MPTWANRWASSVTRLPARITCGCSWRTSKEPSQVRSSGDALGLLQHDAQPLQRLDDLDAVAPDPLVEPVVVDRVGEVDRGLLVAAAHEHEGVLGAEVGVVAASR